MGTFMSRLLTASALDVIQNPFQKESHIENLPEVKVSPLYPDSNCVVHDDTFDWGGQSDIITPHESDNDSSNGKLSYFPYDGKH